MVRGYLAVKLTDAPSDEVHAAAARLHERIVNAVRDLADFKLYAPHQNTDPHAVDPDGLSPRDIYLLDRVLVTHAHILIASLERPSFGVGAELQQAAEFGIPVIAFYYEQAHREPSRLVLGMPHLSATFPLSDAATILRYPPTPDGETALIIKIRNLVSNLLPTLVRDARPRSHLLARTICKLKIRQGMTDAQLASRAGLPLGTVCLIAMAGAPFMEWASQSEIQGRHGLIPDAIDEDRILLPGFHATNRILHALGTSLANVLRDAP